MKNKLYNIYIIIFIIINFFLKLKIIKLKIIINYYIIYIFFM